MTAVDTIPAWSHVVDLSGRTVLVVGGSGGVGEGVVRTLLASGATVVATGRDGGRLEALAERNASERLVVRELDALDPRLDSTIGEIVEQSGPLDGVVVSVASWGDQGRKSVISLTDDEWDALLAPNLTSVFRLYRAVVPHLRRTGALVLLNGYSAEIPFPGSAGVALSAAATKSMTRSLAAELAGRGPRVYDVILGVVRTRARQLAGIDDPRWIDGTEVGAHVAELVAGTSPLTPLDLHYFTDKAAGPQPVPPER
jgi:NAD(P)-dependent dehydrogenase (short-subunit alcohol dehydrogenase family)